MIDTLLIVFSLGAVICVSVRAILLDRALPWFPPVSRPSAGKPAVAGLRASDAVVGWRGQARVGNREAG